MSIYYNFMLMLLIIGLIYRQESISKKNACIFIGTLLFVIAGFRDSIVGNDTWNYFNMYKFNTAVPVKSIIENSNKDLVFNLFCHYLGKVFVDPQWLLIVTAVLFTYSIFRLIYLYSDDIILSTVILFSFNLFQFSMTGIRQTIALSILIMAFMHFVKKKYFISFLLILLASLSHLSALIFLSVFILKYIPFNKKTVFISCFVILSSYFWKDSIGKILVLLVQDRGYEFVKQGGGEIMFWVIFVVYLLGVIYPLKDKDEDYDSIINYKMMFIGLIFQSGVPVQNILFRLAMYFTFTLVIYIPKFINSINDRETRYVATITTYFLLLIQYFFFTKNAGGIIPYKFFWEI